MFRSLILYAILTSALIAASVHVAFTQETEIVQEQEEFDHIIGEALDQVEQGLEPVVLDETLSLDPALSDISTLKTDTDVPDGSTDPDEVIRIPEIELETAVPPEASEKLKEAEVKAPEPAEAIEVKVIPLLHAEASGLIETLNGMKSPVGEVTYNEDDRTLILRDTPGPLEAMEDFVKETDILLETEIFNLEHVHVEDIIGDIEDALTRNIGQVHFDEQEDSVVITDTPAKIEAIRELMIILDRIDREVLIKTKTLQIVLNDEHLSGVDWEAIISDFKKWSFPGRDTGAKSKEGESISVGTISKEDYAILLEALDTVGAVSIVSEDELTVENEAETMAHILSSGSEEGQEEKGSEVRLVPSIRRDQFIEVSLQSGPAEKIPEKEDVLKERIMIQVQDGATIVTGGLFEDTLVASTWKIPLLGDLPLLGFVFRNEGEELRKAEIMTFITVISAEEKKNDDE